MNPNYKEDCQDIDNFFKDIACPKKKAGRPVKATVQNGEKYCTKCNKWVSLANYSKNKSAKDRYSRYCRPCLKIYTLEWQTRINYKPQTKPKFELAKPVDPDFEFFKQFAQRPETVLKLNSKLHSDLIEDLKKVTDISVLKRIYCICNIYRLGRKSLTSAEDIAILKMNKEELVDFFNKEGKNEMQ